MIEKPTYVDLAVIGSGPNGLYAAKQLQLEFPHLSVAIFEQGPIAASNMALYPNVRWHSTMVSLTIPSSLNSVIPSNYAPLSSELANYYQWVALESQIPIFTNSKVTELVQSGPELEGNWNLVLESPPSSSWTLAAGTVIIATGIYDNPVPLPGFGMEMVRRYLDIGITGKRLVLCGGGTSAADAITHLLPSNEIFWILRGDKPHKVWVEVRPKFESVVSQYGGNLTMITGTQMTSVVRDTVLLDNGQSISGVDEVLALIGFASLSGLVSKSGIRTSNGGLWLSEDFETNLPGVFAFGSISSRWDDEKQKIDQSFVENGNPDKFEAILAEIKSQYARDVFVHGFGTDDWRILNPEDAPAPLPPSVNALLGLLPKVAMAAYRLRNLLAKFLRRISFRP